ncbi:MAG: NAD(P)H-dependent oxidoreductase subunit E [Acidimicrobiaceae bacterium]|jgi:NADH-quinone oxidoreductase subunit E|nr:NAD(P)H-dependent oxidoreductase subunit E [Acidimicrobiaceae bacterium]|tara:strand:- start:60 stop:671 length:612 start_codon:yes stop_codon:yes gene_type:complete
MNFFSDENLELAEVIIRRYPKPRSAMIPLLHLAQEQTGWVTDDAMAEIAELVGTTSAEVLGTCSFYEMFKRHQVGTYVINICTTMSCALMGAGELMEHAERRLGVKAGGTTADGMFTVEGAECQAACTEAPCLQVNYRHRYRVTPDQFDSIIDELSSTDHDVPDHGVLSQMRQHIPEDRFVGTTPPENVTSAPVWMHDEGVDQ